MIHLIIIFLGKLYNPDNEAVKLRPHKKPKTNIHPPAIMPAGSSVSDRKDAIIPTTRKMIDFLNVFEF